MSDAPQTYENHAKMVPLFHYVTFGLLMINLVWSGRALFRDVSADNGVAFLLAVGLILLGWFTRSFPLGVQDRLIRLEERLRMERVLPEDLKSRIGDFTTDQFVALRFASDAELPALARRVLNEGISDRRAIKKAVQSWRADHHRI